MKLEVGVQSFSARGVDLLQGCYKYFMKNRGLSKRKIKNIEVGIMVLKRYGMITVLIWYELEITLFQNINSKGMHHLIHKTGIKQIRINTAHL